MCASSQHSLKMLFLDNLKTNTKFVGEILAPFYANGYFLGVKFAANM